MRNFAQSKQTRGPVSEWMGYGEYGRATVYGAGIRISLIEVGKWSVRRCYNKGIASFCNPPSAPRPGGRIATALAPTAGFDHTRR